MITAILDANVLVQAVISSRRSASSRVLRAYRDKKYRLVFFKATLVELHSVLTLPRIRSRHGWTDDELRRHFTFLLANSRFCSAVPVLPHSITRDLTDTKYLALAEASHADYLVTNDHRHLLRLRHYGRTRIVTPTQFLRRLG